MAYLELNALSTVLGGSFTARVFLPEIEKLDLDDKDHAKRYPLLLLLHTDGETSLSFLKTPVESLAEEYGLIAVAPDLHHSMGVDMKWGPNSEKFLCKELRGILKHLLPVSTERKDNFIGGVGTGGYAAVKCALKHPELYSKAFSLNGVLDMAKLIKKTGDGENTGVPQTAQALSAVFGGEDDFTGGRDDIFSMAEQENSPEIYLSVERDFICFDDSVRFAERFKNKATLDLLRPGAEMKSYQTGMDRAVRWLLGERGM